MYGSKKKMQKMFICLSYYGFIQEAKYNYLRRKQDENGKIFYGLLKYKEFYSFEKQPLLIIKIAEELKILNIPVIHSTTFLLMRYYS